MGGSFILKDKMGRPGGYVMRDGDVLRLRANVPGAAQGTLLYADGQCQTLALAPGEQSFPAQGTLTGVYVTVEGALTLFTDDAARAAFARQALRVSPSDQTPRRTPTDEANAAAPQPPPCEPQACEPQACDTTEQTPPQAMAPDGARPCARATDWPQRRWPPPPCLRAPRYVDGAWRDAAEEVRSPTKEAADAQSGAQTRENR